MLKFAVWLLVVTAGVGATLWYRDADLAVVEPPVYRFVSVSRGDIASTVSASGTLQAVVTVDVGTQVSGMIKSLHADFNSEVKAGEVIARIDSAPFEASLSQVEAELAVARASVAMQEASLDELEAELDGLRASQKEAEEDLKRKRSLQSRGAASSSVVDSAGAVFEQAAARVKAGRARLAKQRAQIELARAQAQQKTAVVEQRRLDLQYTYIRSPVDGVVISRNVSEGQTVAASLQTPVLFWIAQDLTDMEVNVSVDEADIGQIRVGQQVEFSVDAHPRRTFSGRVKQIRKAGQEISNVVTYTVVASAANDDQLLLPGMTATVTIVTGQREDVLKIPNAAFFYRPWDPGDERWSSGSRIWVLDDTGRPRPLVVDYGLTDGNASEITKGDLQPGQRVITGEEVRPPSPRRSWLRLGL